MKLAKPFLHIVLNIALGLLVTNVQTASVGDYSDLLSNLFRKATVEDRPMVLIFDNHHNHRNKQLPHHSDDKNYNNDRHDDGEHVPYPFLYLYKLAHEAKADNDKNDIFFRSNDKDWSSRNNERSRSRSHGNSYLPTSVTRNWRYKNDDSNDDRNDDKNVDRTDDRNYDTYDDRRDRYSSRSENRNNNRYRNSKNSKRQESYK